MKRGPEEKFLKIDALTVRYLEQGHGPPVLFLHGASLGSSADVFLGLLDRFADAGFCALALDIPGYGLSDVPARQSRPVQRQLIRSFVAALGLSKVALIAHSRAGGDAVLLALEAPDSYRAIVILGTGYLLPPASDQQINQLAALQARIDRRLAAHEPTLDDVRKLLEADLFNHALISKDVLDLRHSRSIGKNFIAHVARQQEEGFEITDQFGTPLWQRVRDVKPPVMLIYGKDDRGNAAARAAALKSQYPDTNIHIVPNCKHMVPWDAADLVVELVVPFLRSNGEGQPILPEGSKQSSRGAN